MVLWTGRGYTTYVYTYRVESLHCTVLIPVKTSYLSICHLHKITSQHTRRVDNFSVVVYEMYIQYCRRSYPRADMFRFRFYSCCFWSSGVLGKEPDEEKKHMGEKRSGGLPSQKGIDFSLSLSLSSLSFDAWQTVIKLPSSSIHLQTVTQSSRSPTHCTVTVLPSEAPPPPNRNPTQQSSQHAYDSSSSSTVYDLTLCPHSFNEKIKAKKKGEYENPNRLRNTEYGVRTYTHTHIQHHYILHRQHTLQSALLVTLTNLLPNSLVTEKLKHNIFTTTRYDLPLASYHYQIQKVQTIEQSTTPGQRPPGIQSKPIFGTQDKEPDRFMQET